VSRSSLVCLATLTALALLTVGLVSAFAEDAATTPTAPAGAADAKAPSVASPCMLAGSAQVCKAYANKDTFLRAAPSAQAAGLAIQKGQELCVFEGPCEWVPEWRAVLCDDRQNPWAWVRQDDLKLDESRRLFPAIGRAAPMWPVQTPPPPAAPNTPAKLKALQIAIWFAQNRIPYRMGAQGTSSTDQSGLVWFCFTRAGVWPKDAERTAARDQANQGRQVMDGKLKPGDRIYWSYGRLGAGGIDHTGIYLGGGMDVEATPRYVQIRSFNSRRSHLVKVMRDEPY
jgi:cell wall-associated NlpC family hydrolase